MHKRLVYRTNSKLHLIGMKIACMLRTYITCNPTIGFPKYEFNNKLLSGVTFFRVTSSVT